MRRPKKVGGHEMEYVLESPPFHEHMIHTVNCCLSPLRLGTPKFKAGQPAGLTAGRPAPTVTPERRKE